MEANIAAMKAAHVLGWIKDNPHVQNINSVETLSIGLDVLTYPSEEGKVAARAIWETRKANAEVFCQATEDSAYVALMEAIIYGEEMPQGLVENRAYVERTFGVNVYARIGKAEQRERAYDNPIELMELVNARVQAQETLDPTILEYTNVMLQELHNTLNNNFQFENIPVASRQM